MEKTLFNQVGEVKGKASEKEESFSFQFTPQNENLRRTRGALFTLVTVETDETNKAEKAKAFYHAFQSSYYAKVSGSIINSLADTLDQINTDIVKKEAQTGTNIAMVAAVFWGSILYLAKLGSSGVFVARGGKLKKLEVNKVVSGVLEDGDSVCLASAKFLDVVDQEELKDYLSEEKFEKSLEKIDGKIAQLEGATCIVIRLSVNQPESKPEQLEVGEVDEGGEVSFSEGKETVESLPESKETSETSLSAESTQPVDASETGTKKYNNLINVLTSKAKVGLEKTRVFTARVTSRIISKIAKPWHKSDPGEHIDHVAIKKQRTLQIVIVIVLLLVLSISFGVYSKSQADKKEKLNQLFSTAESSLEQAKNLKTIDPTQAQKFVQKAKDSASEAKKLGGEESRVTEIEGSAASLLAEITRSYGVKDLTEVFDFTSLVSEVKLARLSGLADLLVLTDKENSAIYKYDLNDKEGSKVEGDFKEPENLTAFSSGFYVQTKEGVVSLDNSGGKPKSVANSSGWGAVVGAAAYQANLYLLDKTKGEIWRYFGVSSGLSSARAYLVGEKPNLTEAAAIGIDDLVWVATRKGNIYKFAQGKKQEFSLSNLSDSFGDVVDFYTSSETKNHYILDQGKARVVIVSKDGVYQAQYNHQRLHEATSIFVNEAEKTVYFAAGGKLYSFKFS